MEGKNFNTTTMPSLRWPGTRTIQMQGRSMETTDVRSTNIPQGSYLALKPLQTSIIEWGEIYAVETSAGTIVKRLYPADDDLRIRCVSNNKNYPPFEVEKCEIISIAKVTGVLNVRIL